MRRKTANTNGSKDGIPIRCSHTGTADPKALKPNPRNPKKHSKKKIELYAKIIKEGGWRRAIAISSRSGMIVHGHGAQLAAIELGCKVVPIDTQEFDSDAAEQAAMLADNWLAEAMLDYDQTLSADLVNELKESGFDTQLAGVMESLVDESVEVEVRKMTVMAPPKMAWVLIGIPTVEFGSISAMVEKLGRVKGVVLETTQNDG